MSVSLTEQAIATIRRLILSGELAPGSRLPPENELAALVGSSRNTTREAVATLAAARVLNVRRGDGTYVTSLRPELLLHGIGSAVDLVPDENLLELVEVRRALEPAATELAALRATPEQLAAIREQFDLMVAAGADPERLVTHDTAFHALVAEASGNATMGAVLSGISSRTLRVRVWRGLVDDSAHQRTVAEHETILAALTARDPVLARAAATVHVATTENSVRRLLAPS